MKFIRFLILILLAISCKEDRTKTKDLWDTVIFHRRAKKVLVYKRQVMKHEIKDSVVYLDYRYKFKEDTFYFDYQFPINGKIKHEYGDDFNYRKITLMDSLKFEKEQIFKYDLDIAGSDNNGIAYYLSLIHI